MEVEEESKEEQEGEEEEEEEPVKAKAKGKGKAAASKGKRKTAAKRPAQKKKRKQSKDEVAFLCNYQYALAIVHTVGVVAWSAVSKVELWKYCALSSSPLAATMLAIMCSSGSVNMLAESDCCLLRACPYFFPNLLPDSWKLRLWPLHNNMSMCIQITYQTLRLRLHVFTYDFANTVYMFAHTVCACVCC